MWPWKELTAASFGRRTSPPFLGRTPTPSGLNLRDFHSSVKTFCRSQLEDLAVDLAAFPRLCLPSQCWVPFKTAFANSQAGRDLPGSTPVPARGEAKPLGSLHWREVASHPITSLQIHHSLPAPSSTPRIWMAPMSRSSAPKGALSASTQAAT